MASASDESDSGFIAENPVQLNEYDVEPENPTVVYNPSRKRTAPMPSSDSEDSSEDVQDVEMSDLDSDDLSNVILPTGSAAKKSVKKSTPVKPVAGTSKKSPRTPVARKRNTKVPAFTTGLKALTVAQLVDLIENVIRAHPEIKNEFVSKTPTPDLAPLENKLENLKKSIYKAFPYSKYGNDRDGFCFRRVRGHLAAFKTECFLQCKTLTDSQQWKSSIDYICMAWKFVSELPDWNDSAHNKNKEMCYKKLVTHLTNALKKGIFEDQELEGYIDEFKELANEYSRGDSRDGMNNCIALAASILQK